MKNLIMTTALIALFLPSAKADVLGVKAGYQYWKSEVSGYFGEGADSTITNDGRDNTFGKFYIAFEHPMPLIPNVELALTQHDVSASDSITSTYVLGDQTFPVATDLAGRSDTSSVDILLYYEVFDSSIVNLDVGVNTMYYSVDYVASDVASSLTGENTVSTIIPMLYARAESGLPLLGISGYVSLMSGSDAEKIDAGVSYKFIDSAIIDMTMSFGYRESSVTLDDVDDIFAMSEYDGIYLGIQFDI